MLKKKLIFVHVPKTAGSSFSYFLRKAYSQKYKFIRDTEKYWRGYHTNYKDYESYDVISGHFHACKYKHLNCTMVTFIRDPVERLISQYYYSKKPDGIEEDIPLGDYASLPICRNMMSKQLESLKYFHFIGMQETFNDSLFKFERYMDMSLLKRRDIQKRDNGHNKKKVSDEIKNHIRNMNKEDYKMYEMALMINRTKK